MPTVAFSLAPSIETPVLEPPPMQLNATKPQFYCDATTVPTITVINLRTAVTTKTNAHRHSNV